MILVLVGEHCIEKTDELSVFLSAGKRKFGKTGERTLQIKGACMRSNRTLVQKLSQSVFFFLSYLIHDIFFYFAYNKVDLCLGTFPALVMTFAQKFWKLMTYITFQLSETLRVSLLRSRSLESNSTLSLKEVSKRGMLRDIPKNRSERD